MLGGGSTNTAGLEAIQKTLAQFSDSQNLSAISTLNGQMQQLARSMNIKELPVLITRLERMGVLTRQQAEELNKLNQAGPGMFARLGKSLTGLSNPIHAFTLATGGAAMMLERFVAKANPASAFQFNRALDDMAGTLGQILTPILEGVTILIRAYSDVLQGLRPALDPIMRSVGTIIAELSKLIEPLVAMSGLNEALQAIGWVMDTVIVPVIREFVSIMTEFANVVKDVIETISFGLISLEFKKGSSVGAAVQPASYSKNIEDIGKRTTMAALNQGTGGLSKDAEAITKNQLKMNDLLEKIANKIGDVLAQKLGVSRDNVNKGAKVAGSMFFPLPRLIAQLRDM